MKRQLKISAISAALLIMAVPLQASISWTSAPLLLPEKVKGGDRRSQSAFRAHHINTAIVKDFPPASEESKPGELKAQDNGSFIMQPAGKNQGNYHWFSAVDKEALRFASTVNYFSSPGPAPRQMLKQNKSPLEIKPVDLPREHQRFRANESWDFIVLTDGKPLPATRVLLETSNGSSISMTTNSEGIVSVTFPDDFAAFAEKHKNHDMGGHASHGRQSAQFVVSVQHENKTSAFNYQYGEDAFTNKAVLPAVGYALSASLFTGFLLFRRRAA